MADCTEAPFNGHPAFMAVEYGADGLVASAAPVAEPTDVGEPPKPPSGWPEAVAKAEDVSGEIRLGTLPDEARAAFTDRIRRKRLAQRPMMPVVSYRPLALAIRAAAAVRDAAIEPDVAHSVAEQFRDDDDCDLQDVFLDAYRLVEQALDNVLAVRTPSAAVAVEKVQAFFIGQGCAISPEGDITGASIGEEPKFDAFLALWRDMQELANADDELLTLGEEFERRWSLEREIIAAEGDDAALDAAADYTASLAHQIARIPADTVEGFRLKARVVGWGWGNIPSLLDSELKDAGTYATFIRQMLGELLDHKVDVPWPSKVARYDGVSGAPPSPHIPTTTAELYEAWRAARDHFNSDDDLDAEDRDHDRVMALCYATLDAPIIDTADATAKIAMASESLCSGELSNGKDVAAFRQIASWLEARC